MKKKYSLTLLEIMIVIFLIGLIGSVIGYNMKGSLDKGRAFRTEQAAEQIRDILLMEIAKGASADEVISKKEEYLKHSGLVKDPTKLLKDGWGQPFTITKKSDDDIRVVSRRLQEYRSKNKKPGEIHENDQAADSEVERV